MKPFMIEIVISFSIYFRTKSLSSNPICQIERSKVPFGSYHFLSTASLQWFSKDFCQMYLTQKPQFSAAYLAKGIVSKSNLFFDSFRLPWSIFRLWKRISHLIWHGKHLFSLQKWNLNSGNEFIVKYIPSSSFIK